MTASCNTTVFVSLIYLNVNSLKVTDLLNPHEWVNLSVVLNAVEYLCNYRD